MVKFIWKIEEWPNLASRTVFLSWFTQFYMKFEHRCLPLLGVSDVQVHIFWQWSPTTNCLLPWFHGIPLQHVEPPSRNGGNAAPILAPRTKLHDAWAGPVSIHPILNAQPFGNQMPTSQSGSVDVQSRQHFLHQPIGRNDEVAMVTHIIMAKMGSEPSCKSRIRIFL